MSEDQQPRTLTTLPVTPERSNSVAPLMWKESRNACEAPDFIAVGK